MVRSKVMVEDKLKTRYGSDTVRNIKGLIESTLGTEKGLKRYQSLYGTLRMTKRYPRG